MGPQIVIEFALGAHHALKRAEALQVSPPHIGNETTGRLHVIYQALNVARVRSAHLHYGYLMLWRQPQQRLRHAYIIIIIGFGVHHAVALGQHGRHQFLRGGLAVGSGNTDDGYIELAAMLAGQLLISYQRIGHQDVAAVGLIVIRIVYHRIGAALVQRCLGKLIAIE